MKKYGSYWKSYEYQNPAPPQNGMVLSKLFEDVDMAKKMGNEGRKFIERTFNWKLVTKNFIEMIKPYLK